MSRRSESKATEEKADNALYVVIDNESGALEYGPAPDKDAAQVHANKLRALDLRGELAGNVGRDLCVYKLTRVRGQDSDASNLTRVATDRVDRWDRTSAENAGDDNVEPVS